VKAIVQRVTSASVEVAAHKVDTDSNADKMADRIKNLRIFNDAEGKMNLSLSEVQGEVLAVSNFTVYGETAKGRRPSFIESAPYDQGELLFNRFVASLKAIEVKVETGVFGANMQVSLVNDGPVTVIVET
jgi:D-aminoacyl-tRNA deacylase